MAPGCNGCMSGADGSAIERSEGRACGNSPPPHGTGTFENKREDQQAYERRTNNPNGNKGGHDIGRQVKRDWYNLIARDLQQSISPVPQSRVRWFPTDRYARDRMKRRMEAVYIRIAKTLAAVAR